ncbi:hypothetical protein ACQEU5_14055 [Marinactinospora thermotolerans]|uniref:hypothetical protein n=1 Tax=Marinactinospora thermotolerans TaxID=531310 RepID=UPI003D89F863
MTWPGHDPRGGGWERPATHEPRRPAAGGVSPMMAAVLAIVFAAVLIVAGAVVVITLREDTGEAVASPPQGGSSQEAAAPTREETPSSQEEERPPAEAPAEPTLQEGWTAVRVAKWGLTYEVPGGDGWTVDTPTTIRGWEGAEGDQVSMSGTAGYHDGYRCDHRSLAELGARGIVDSADTEEMTEAAALQWALASYHTEAGQPEVSTASVEEFAANGLSGHHAVVDVEVRQDDPDCDPATARVHAVGVPTDGDGAGTRLLIIDVHTGVEGALGEDVVETIVSTLRDSDTDIA